MLFHAALLAASVTTDASTSSWSEPERARAVPNIQLWASTRTFLNVGYTSTVWQRGFGAMYVGFSFGGTGPSSPGVYQVTAPELGVKVGSPRFYFQAGSGISAGDRIGTGGHVRYGLNTKLLFGVQPWQQLGFIGGIAAFAPIGTARVSPDQTFALEGILGVQLGF